MFQVGQFSKVDLWYSALTKGACSKGEVENGIH